MWLSQLNLSAHHHCFLNWKHRVGSTWSVVAQVTLGYFPTCERWMSPTRFLAPCTSVRAESALNSSSLLLSLSKWIRQRDRVPWILKSMLIDRDDRYKPGSHYSRFPVSQSLIHMLMSMVSPVSSLCRLMREIGRAHV